MDEQRYIRPIDMMGIQDLLVPELIEAMAFHYWVKERLIYLCQLQNGGKFAEAFRLASHQTKVNWFANLDDNFADFLREYQEQTEDYFDQNYLDAIIEGTRPDRN